MLRAIRCEIAGFAARHAVSASLACLWLDASTASIRRIATAPSDAARSRREIGERWERSLGQRRQHNSFIPVQLPMRLNRITIGALALGATLLPAPAVALASPLLSGYGGPGAGTQQIVGAALVGGGGGGNSGATGGGGEAAAGSGAGESAGGGSGESAGGKSGESGAATSGEAAAGSGGARTSGAQTHSAAGSSHSSSRRGAAGGRSGSSTSGSATAAGGSATGGSHSGAGSHRSATPHLPAATQAAATQSVTLGLSSGQLLMVALIAGALLLTAALTLWLGALQRRHEAADVDQMRSQGP